MRRALVTGGAGFIGSHLVERLLTENWRVTVLDNFDPFYDPAVKRRNLAAFSGNPAFRAIEGDIRDRAAIGRARGDYDVIVHLAAKAGVRPSIDDPFTYQEVNVSGTQNLLEMTRELGVKQFVFGSSSSIYGINPDVPWREDSVPLPISPYASTKISGELLGHVYAHLYAIRFVALRFFTVYGPRQRPDLAIHKFARQILSDEPVTIYGDGRTRRDYTFVDDIVNGIRSAMDFSESSFEAINLGCGNPVSLVDMVEAVEDAIGKRAIRRYREEQPGDVPQTFACIDKARKLLGYEPRVGLNEGVRSFVSWLQSASPAGVGAA